MGFSSLLLFGSSMFAASFLIGLLPLSLTLSPKRLQFISAFGIGLLIGTALTVIIPEGIHTFYEAAAHSGHRHEAQANAEGLAVFHTAELAALACLENSQPQQHSSSTVHSVDSSPIGAALGFGFILMFLIDRMSAGQGEAANKQKQRETGEGEESSNETLIQISAVPSAVSPSSSSVSSNRAVIGILVHSAVDGIALGAISVGSNPRLESVVFLAILLHKAPAAFGLSAFLLAQGRALSNIRCLLLAFSLAAPIAALVTFAAFSVQGPASVVDQRTLGLLLLFSGGTFLFTIATHIMPELQQINEKQNSAENNKKSSDQNIQQRDSHGHGHSHGPPSSWASVFVLISGILLPLVLSSGPHAH